MRQWSDEEIAILRELYPQGVALKTIARKLHRSETAIKTMALRLGLRREKKGIPRGSPWTPEKIEILKREYSTTPSRDLARKLGVSIYSLHHKAYSLGLHKKIRTSKIVIGEWFSPRVEKVPSDEVAYIAGILDGEGTIRIGHDKRADRFYPEVFIVNTNKDLMEYLHKKIGGSHYTEVRHKNRKNEQDCYRVRLTQTEKILAFLRTVLPYLRVKRKQAELMIRFCEIKLKRVKGGEDD